MESGLKLLVWLFLKCSLVLAQAQINLDEFETDLSGGLKKEAEAEKPKVEDNKSPTPTAQNEDGEYERIQVTGSHIKRIDMEGVSPVQVLDRAMLERSGYNSVSDVLRDMTANSFGSTREASGSGAAGVASVSLRGLGANKTLVLLNGKRLPPDAVTGSVDLNLIPMAAVKQIDILKDGASATYGSDALGGVVNIITYHDYIGTQISGQKSFNKFKGGETQELSMITGSATSNSSIITVISYRENSKIFDRDRPWSDEGFSNTGSPGSFRDNSGLWKPDPNNCAAGDIVGGGGGNNFCRFQFSNFSTSLPELKQLSMMSLFEYETENDITFFGRASATRKLINWQYAPAPGTFSVPAATAATLGLGGAYGGGDLAVRYRTTELGNRVSEIETTGLGFQAGVKGSVSSSWDWELTMDQNRVRNIDIGVSGYALKTNIEELIQTGAFNPFAAAGSRGSVESARYEPWKSSQSELTMYELKFSGELFETKNGAAGAAIGAVKTKEMFSDKADKLSENDEVFGGAGSSGGGDRDVKSFYVETVTPLLKGMELQLAGRYDDFSDFGSTTNPKIGLKYQVTESWLLRASAGTGFKAPSLNDLYAAQSFGFQTFIDAVACKNEQQNTPNDTPSCAPQQWAVQSGGNKGLQEEKSQSFNIGTVVQIDKTTGYSIDYWLTKLNNVVGINYQRLTEAERDGVNVASSGITVTRDANGYIDQINAPLLNLSSQEISGLDFHFHTGSKSGFRMSMDHAYLFFFKQEGFPGTGFQNFLGTNGLPSWRNNVNFGFDKGKQSTNLLFRTINSHLKSVPSEGKVKRYTEIDFVYNLSLAEKTTLTFGVQNVLGTIPPLDKTNATSTLDTSLYNPRGQMAYVGFKQNF